MKKLKNFGRSYCAVDEEITIILSDMYDKNIDIFLYVQYLNNNIDKVCNVFLKQEICG